MNHGIPPRIEGTFLLMPLMTKVSLTSVRGVLRLESKEIYSVVDGVGTLWELPDRMTNRIQPDGIGTIMNHWHISEYCEIHRRWVATGTGSLRVCLSWDLTADI